MKALLPLSWLYRAAIALRNSYYDHGGTTKLSVPVVSVGNLTVGGSGKTPLVAALAKELLAKGYPVAVLSRGYGREGDAPFTLVSDGKRVLVDARTGGDEPVELAESVPGLVVAVGGDRIGVAKTLLEKLGPHLIVLDDGFQHRRLARDVDLVCFDCSEGSEGYHLLPAGRLREPFSSLRRASAVVLTRWRDGCAPPLLGDFPTDIPTIRAVTRVTALTRLDGDGSIDANGFHGRAVALALGIARPERVGVDVDARVVLTVSRRDHHRWSESELRDILENAKTKGAEALLTTGKDAVKMALPSPAALPVYRIDIETEILDLETLHGLVAFPSL